MTKTITLAAAQIWSAKTRAYRRLKPDPVKVNEHFKKYNIGAATYDPQYCHDYGLEYLTYIHKQIQKAAKKKPDLLLLPEFLFTPGVMATPMKEIGVNPRVREDALKLYRWSGKLISDSLCAWAKETGLFLGASSFIVQGDEIFNMGLLADDKGELILQYKKVHLPIDEKLSVTAGTEYNFADTRLGRIAFAICYDIQFPEHHACLATRGVEIVLHPSGGYTLPDEGKDMGQNRLRIRASDSHSALVYSCFAPESDWEPRESAVIGPNGNVLSCVRGKRAGLAIGKVTLGKRAWPGEKPEGPDWEKIRRSCRMPQTYETLLK